MQTDTDEKYISTLKSIILLMKTHVPQHVVKIAALENEIPHVTAPFLHRIAVATRLSFIAAELQKSGADNDKLCNDLVDETERFISTMARSLARYVTDLNVEI